MRKSLVQMKTHKSWLLRKKTLQFLREITVHFLREQDKQETPQFLREKTIHFLREQYKQEQGGQTQDTLDLNRLP